MTCKCKTYHCSNTTTTADVDHFQIRNERLHDETGKGLDGLGAPLDSVVPFPDFLGLAWSVGDGEFKFVLVAKLKQMNKYRNWVRMV